MSWALIAGGGTAGHVHPALAIAEELVRRGHPRDSIVFVGSRRGIEADVVPPAGFQVTLLPGRGIQRRLTLDNVAAVGGLAVGMAEALAEVRRQDPAVVVAMGGYASAPPCAIAAGVLRVPMVVAEQNAIPGAANRLAARWAKACAVSFAGTPLPRSVLTGNPVRPEVLRVDRSRDRAQARHRIGVRPDDTLVVVFGGSLGAAQINRAAFAAAHVWGRRPNIAVRHIISRRDWVDMADERRALAAVDRYVPVEYETDMPTVLAAADLAVCRAGASTVAELTVVGVPTLLVPFPAATADHQTANASGLATAGAAVVVPDDQVTPERVVAEVDHLLSVPGRLDEMATAAAGLGRRDAAARVADLVEEHASRG